jgi:hypothetical protein
VGWWSGMLHISTLLWLTIYWSWQVSLKHFCISSLVVILWVWAMGPLKNLSKCYPWLVSIWSRDGGESFNRYHQQLYGYSTQKRLLKRCTCVIDTMKEIFRDRSPAMVLAGPKIICLCWWDYYSQLSVNVLT